MHKRIIGVAVMTVLGAGLVVTSASVGAKEPVEIAEEEVVTEEVAEAELAPTDVTTLMTSSEDTSEEPAEATTEVAEEPEEEEDKETYAIAKVLGSVNVRAEASTESDIVGKFADGAVGTVIGTEGDWTKIASGNVEGYVSNEFLTLGEEADTYIAENYKYCARVQINNLNIRAEQSTDSEKLGTASAGTDYDVISETEEWVEIPIDEEGNTGFISKEYTTVGWNYETAKTLEEIEAAEVAAREAAAAAAASTASSWNATGAREVPPVNTSAEGLALGQEIANYACQFVGNPYVYGGCSLTDGTDCSGFTMAVYAQFGYSLSHSSGVQMTQGTAVPLDQVQPGDVICYRGHVGMYIGGGQIVHAGTEATGIYITSMYYDNPTGARRFVQ